MVTKPTIEKKLKEGAPKKGKIDEEATKKEEQETPVPLVNHVNKLLSLIFSNVEVYNNNQQMYNFDGLFAHKSYISNNLKGVISK